MTDAPAVGEQEPGEPLGGEQAAGEQAAVPGRFEVKLETKNGDIVID